MEKMKGIPESERYKETLKLANAISEEGPMLTTKQKTAVAGKEKVAADNAREVNAQLTMATTRPYFWNALYNEFESEPCTLALADERATILPPQLQTFLSDEQQSSLVCFIIAFG
jgi:hypothetical protein